MASEAKIPQSQSQPETPEPEPLQPEPEEKLVQVFGTPQESEALVVQSLLSSAGIESLTVTESPQDILAGVGGFIVRVREDQAADAERILAEYQADGSAAAEEAELESEATNPDLP